MLHHSSDRSSCTRRASRRGALAVAASVVLAPLFGACVVPEDATPGVALDLAVVSQHMHRGMTQNENGGAQVGIDVDFPVKAIPGLDPGRIDVRAWGNADLTDDTGDAWFPDGHEGRFTEIHTMAAHTQRIGPVAVQAGLFSYVLPNGPEFPFGERGQTSEFFVTASTEVLGAIPALSVRYDFDEADDVYLLGSLTEEFPIGEDFAVRATGWLGYSGAGQSSWNYGLGESGFSDLGGEIALDYFFGERTTFEVKVSGSMIVDDELRDWFDLIGIRRDNVWVTGGVRFVF